jgi:DNA-binding beta-propeller fold protein YncE
MKSTGFMVILTVSAATGLLAGGLRPVNGTIWAANRGAHSVAAFDAATGDLIRTVPMAAGSQPGDLAIAKGKVYVAEEFGTPPAVAILDADSGALLRRITFAAGARPHHVHNSPGGNLIAVGLFGTDRVAVIDTADDVLIGEWDSNPATTSGRIHAAVFSQDGNTLYLANEAAGELVSMDPRSGAVAWRLAVPQIHELIVMRNGKTAYVTRRTANRLALVDLETPAYTDILNLGLPDTLAMSANEKLLTVGLRISPARLAVVDTESLSTTLVPLSARDEPGTVGGHQWTSPSGRYTFASFEGGGQPGLAVIDHHEGNAVVQRLPYAGRPHGVDYSPR